VTRDGTTLIGSPVDLAPNFTTSTTSFTIGGVIQEMSHIVTIKTEIRDAVAVRAACNRLKLSPPVQGEHRLFSGPVIGLAVRLPEWRYPVVCDLATGRAHYDNYSGRWGDQVHVDRFQQAYAVEKCRIEARKKGHHVTEQSLPNGSIKLVVGIEGGTA
jgi:hypothetical protein